MVKDSFYNGTHLENQGAGSNGNGATETTLSAKDTFFFYPLYLKNKSQAKSEAQKSLKIHAAYHRNRANIIKEILDMEQLLESKILNTDMDAILSDNPVNKNYAPAFEDLVRRLSMYRHSTGTELFNSLEDIHKYVNYLIETTKPSIKEYSVISQFMDKNKKQRSKQEKK